MFKKRIALVLAGVVFLASMPFNKTFAASIPSETTTTGFIEGDNLIDTSLVSGTAIADHEATDWTQDADAWSYGMPKQGWKWWRSTGTPSAAVTSDNTITFSSEGTDGIILMPTLPSSNYKLEATFTVSDVDGADNGSFGLITNINPTYTESTGGTMFIIYASGHNRASSGKPIYTWNKHGENSAVYYNPDWYTAPGVNEEKTLTVYAYEGVNKYYIDGEYIGSVNSIYTTENESLCGFFNSGATVEISDISVKKIEVSNTETEEPDTETETTGKETEAPDKETETPDTEIELPDGIMSVKGNHFIMGDVLYQTDFENETVGELPAGWQKGYTGNGASFGWGVSDVSQRSMTGEVVELDGYGKVLDFGSVNTDAFISAPATNSLNYIFEATAIINSDETTIGENGTFGLANNFYAGVNDANGCMYTNAFINSTTASDYRYRNGGTKGNWDISYNPTNGDVIKVKIISVNGNNYIYYNNVLSAIAPHRKSSNVTSDNPGFYTYNGRFYITDVKITEISNAEILIKDASVSVTDNNQVNLDVAVSFDKDQLAYSKYVTGDYIYSDSAALKFGVITAVGDSLITQEIKSGMENVTDTVFTTNTQNDSELSFVHSISTIPEENYDKYYTIRPYVLVNGIYFYGEAKTYSPALLANGIYASSNDDTLKAKLDTAFANSNVFVGKEAASLTFTLFSDFHYKAGMYSTSITDLKSILKRADESNSAFILSGGDITNDMKGSPELYNTYLNYITEEGELLPAYNIYGNHELETKNAMEDVTWTLTNTDVVWGTEDHNYDASIAYYYFESNGFRIVCLDTQYSYNPKTKEWEHNKTGSYGAPSGNTNVNSLGPVQLAWLEEVLTDAADNDIPCIVVGHHGFAANYATASADASAIRSMFTKINDKNPGTVLMCINGHTHTNHQGYEDGVFYLDTNTTRNGLWKSGGSQHYTDDQTFMYEEYDDEGNLISITEKPLNTLSQSKNTWFFEDPLSAVVTINEYGVITIDGSESKWAYDVVPDEANATSSGKEPRISSGTYWSCDLLGHNMDYKYDETQHWSECSNTLCDEATAPAAHTYDQEVVSDVFKVSDATCDSPAIYYKSCICGKAGTETFENGSALGHTASEEWKSDDTNHWHDTTCGHNEKIDLAAHNYGDDTICDTCGYEKAETSTDDESANDTESSDSVESSDDAESSDSVESSDDIESSGNGANTNATQNTNSNTSNSTTGTTPSTGDSNTAMPWIALAYIGILGAIAAIVYRKKSM